ncbi:MAG TPA: Wzz/FepE/Etk N-terminal domain-containing protein [Balneolales bacterium]|nr:Wzz/FepE/Etk N-terminal domain-containing protein [Balneolales bacterium]
MRPNFQRPDVTELVRGLLIKWKTILVVIFSVAIITAAISLFLPNQYKSTANLMPVQNKSFGFGMLDNTAVGSLAGSLLGGSAIKDQMDRFYVLLKSYTVKKKVIDKFDLIKEYDTSNSKTPLLDAMNELDENTRLEGHDEGNFTIDVWDNSPELAQKMADFYVHLLNQFNTEISVKQAHEYREVIQKRYQKSVHDLDSLVQANAKFQKQYNVYDLPDQLQDYMTLMGSLVTQKIETEIKLDLLNKSINKTSGVYQNTHNELEAITAKIDSIKKSGDKQTISVSLDNLPKVYKRYFYLQMGLTVEKDIQKYLVPMYEQAKLEEAKAIPVVSIIDAPVVPTKKDRPHRSLIVISAFFSAFIICCAYFTGRNIYYHNKGYFKYLLHSDEI